MATIKSLGIHKPLALPYLVAEGILPPDPPESSYSWETYREKSSAQYEEEELLTTSTCVVWSTCGVIRRVFRFDVEKETVVQAAFTRFATNQSINDINIHAGISEPHDGFSTKETGGFVTARRPSQEHTANGTTCSNGIGASIEQNAALSDFNRLREIGIATNHLERAIIVVLKTQAHIYFLAGASHVVHLPFEVEAVFPLPEGLLLQRKHTQSAKTQRTPSFPSAPMNSFAISQPSSSQIRATPPSLPQAPSSPSHSRLPQSLASLVAGVFSQSKASTDLGLPRSFCLTDPLAELGLVITSERSQKLNSSNSQSASNLDNAETFLYVSPREELPCRASKSTLTPFLLAVTANHQINAFNLWEVAYVKTNPSIHKRQRKPSFINGTRSGPRSSHGPGARTGTTTPGIRTSMGPRESVGNAREGTAGPNSVKDDISLAVQLDTAFEGPGEPDKASRRVSSLLARADLSTSRDRFAFNEFIGTQSTIVANRRGVSLGGRGIRSSIGPSIESVLTAGTQINASHTNHDLSGSIGDLEIDMLQESETDYDLTNSDSTELNLQFQGLRQEIVFKKLYSISSDRKKSRIIGISDQTTRRPKVFCMQPPDWNYEPNVQEIYVCIVDYEAGQFTVLQVDNVPRKTNRLGSGRKSVVTDVKRAFGILDACQISDELHSRILVLSQSEDGFGQISLEVPWSTLLRIRLPPSLLVYDPYQLSHGTSPGRQREGSLNRILSQSPQALSALRNSTGGNYVDIIDHQGTHHRIRIQLSPTNHLVKELISVCQLILSSEAPEREPILRTWWDTLGWLQNRSETGDPEWMAFTVVIFSLTVGFTDTRAQNVVRQRRQKGGLLRSSSDAGIDPANWNSMQLREGNYCSPSPSWIHDPTWNWTFQEGLLDDTVFHHRHSQQPRLPAATVSQNSPKSLFLLDCLNLAKEFVKSATGQLAFGPHGYLNTTLCKDTESRRTTLQNILLGLHLYREEQKLNSLATNTLHSLTPILAQIGGWLGWGFWSWRESSFYMLESSDLDQWLFDDSEFSISHTVREIPEPPSIFSYIEKSALVPNSSRFPTLLDIIPPSYTSSRSTRSSLPLELLKGLTPKTIMILEFLYSQADHAAIQIPKVVELGFNLCILESLPEGVASSIYSTIYSCRMNPTSDWSSSILALIGRDDARLLEEHDRPRLAIKTSSRPRVHEATEDVNLIVQKPYTSDMSGEHDFSSEQDRDVITRMVFGKDQRFDDAAKLLHPVQPSVAYYVPEPDWSDPEIFDAMKELVKRIAIRTLSIPTGRGMIFYNAHMPLLTEKLDIHGFVLSCVMKPANTTIVADKSEFTEERISWAFFHAGVEAGLHISKKAKGINTSWILFNKPHDLNLRHAGFLMALGLNGHLRSLPRWVAFKYLIPKHEVTSIGLLLGLAASFLGTMDDVVTRLLSIHVIRMLPPGAAPLNISALTQTTGIMALGLLYCNTQHRRMSEVMVSEIENIYYDDTNKLKANFKDEGYRLAAGFALGYINLGQGRHLKGLHDMRIVERLLNLAVGTKRLSIAHVHDKSTAPAIIAFALIFMKSHDRVLARKVDVPDTIHQFDYVRPDNFLLRTVARHLIMWDEIEPTMAWIQRHVPKVYMPRVSLKRIRVLRSNDMPLYNIIAGLCLSIGLRFCGTAKPDVRNLLVDLLDQFIRICRMSALTFDGKLTQTTVRNCQDVTSLSVAMVMAGTGDLKVFRRLRSLHGRTDADTPYGSHLAAHMAIGALFLGGGTHTFGTSNLAVASLLCAFYPLFPATVQDNQCHLQAWRHFWALAAEARCVVIRDVDTHHPIPMGITVALRSGTTTAAVSPCLLPELDTVTNVAISDQGYWPAKLDFANNPAHLALFKDSQSIYVRQKAAYDAHDSVFNTTLHALTDTQSLGHDNVQIVDWVYQLPSLRHFDAAERALSLPPDYAAMALQKAIRTTVVDDRLVLETACLDSGRAERLWNLRLLFAWADGMKRRGEKLRWLGEEVVEGLRAAVWLKVREEGD